MLVTGECTEVWLQTHTRLLRLRSPLTVHRLKHQKKGGQSAPRFQRTRLNQIDEYVASAAAEVAAALPKTVVLPGGLGSTVVPDIVFGGHGDCLDKVMAAVPPGVRSRVRQVIRTDGAGASSSGMEAIRRIAARITVETGAAEADGVADAFLAALDASDPCIVYGIERATRCVVDLRVAQAAVVSSQETKARLLQAMLATTATDARGAAAAATGSGGGKKSRRAATGGAGTSSSSSSDDDEDEDDAGPSEASLVPIYVSKSPRLAAFGGILVRTFYAVPEDTLAMAAAAGAGTEADTTSVAASKPAGGASAGRKAIASAAVAASTSPGDVVGDDDMASLLAAFECWDGADGDDGDATAAAAGKALVVGADASPTTHPAAPGGGATGSWEDAADALGLAAASAAPPGAAASATARHSRFKLSASAAEFVPGGAGGSGAGTTVTGGW